MKAKPKPPPPAEPRALEAGRAVSSSRAEDFPSALLLLRGPRMEGGAPLATLVRQHIRPMTANFLASGVSLPMAIGIAKLPFLLAALHGDLIVLDPALDKAAEQRLSTLLPRFLFTPGRQNNGVLGVALRHLRSIPRIECVVPLRGRGRRLALEVLGEGRFCCDYPANDE